MSFAALELQKGLNVAQVPIDKVIPYARNPRKNEGAVAKVAASIREFGFRQPIVVDAEMTVIAGHTRLLAARLLGLTEVPIHVAEGLTAAQVKAYRLADNRVAQDAEWDDPLLALEFNDLELDGFDLSVTGFTIGEITNTLGRGDVITDPNAAWQGMPEFVQEDKEAFKTLAVHFKDQEAVDQFAKLVGQKITPNTRFLWYPEIEIERYADKRYATKP